MAAPVKREPRKTAFTIPRPPELADFPNKGALRMECHVGAGASRMTVTSKCVFNELNSQTETSLGITLWIVR